MPLAAAPYRASGLVPWHKADVPHAPTNVRCWGEQRTCSGNAATSAFAYYSHNNTALKAVKPQNKKGLTETMIFPSAVCFTLNSSSFFAVASATVTYNNPNASNLLCCSIS